MFKGGGGKGRDRRKEKVEGQPKSGVQMVKIYKTKQKSIRKRVTRREEDKEN